MSAQEKDWPIREFIYVGDRLNQSGKLSTGFILLPEGRGDDDDISALSPSWWSLKGKSRNATRRLRVGAVVRMEAEVRLFEHISIRVGTLRTVRLDCGADPERILLWTAEHVADRAEAERLKKMSGRDALHEALDPIREMYRGLRGRHRTAILAEIVRYVTS